MRAFRDWTRKPGAGGHTPLPENRRRLGRRDTGHISGNWIDYRHRMVGTQPCRCRIVVRIVRDGNRFTNSHHRRHADLATQRHALAVSWLFGGGFAIGDLASFTLWLGQSKELPAIPVFGILPEPVSSELWRTVALNAPLAIAALVGLLAVFLPQGFACRPLNVRNTSTPRPGTGFADLLRRGILPERDADLTGIHIAVRSVQWIAWRSSSCSHRRRRHGLHQSRRSFDRTGTYRGMAGLALIGIALVFPIVWLVERIKDSATTPRHRRAPPFTPRS